MELNLNKPTQPPITNDRIQKIAAQAELALQEADSWRVRRAIVENAIREALMRAGANMNCSDADQVDNDH